MPHDFDTDHHFTGDQQAQYDSLHTKGRSFYDFQRWYSSTTHDDAWNAAFEEFGLKNPLLITDREREALLSLRKDLLGS